jgi:hypothetical protein
VQKGILSLLVGVALSLSSASAQPISRDQTSPSQSVPSGALAPPPPNGGGAAAQYGPLMVASQPGDLDGDGDVDRHDLSRLLADRGTSASHSACGTPCDLDGDGMITALDARKLQRLCTRPRCATK